jgi:hypothetical protein
MQEVIDKYRATCQFFLKMDLGFLAGIATLSTVFKLQRDEFIYFVYGEPELIVAFSIMFCFGLLFDRLLLWQWSKNESIPKNNARVLAWLGRGITAQVIVHILALIVIVVTIASYSSGYVEGGTHARLQFAIEEYRLENGHYPANLADIIHKSSDINSSVNRIGIDNLSYKTDEKRGYILRIAGRHPSEGDHQSFLEMLSDDSGFKSRFTKK